MVAADTSSIVKEPVLFQTRGKNDWVKNNDIVQAKMTTRYTTML